jgi:polyferredoxin
MPTKVLSPRVRLLRVLHAQPHRYPRLRRLTQGLTFAVLLAVPALRLARFDLWDGRHLAFGRPVGFVYGAGGVFIAILAFYTATFALNAAMGRVFCGFGCPVGQVSRLGDDVEIAERTGKQTFGARARAAGFAIGLAIAVALWFVSPRVFVEGSARAVGATVLGMLALAAAAHAHGRWLRWRFCEGYCPIGVYYSAVQTDHGFGVHFDAGRGTCKECDACALACPVALDPRDLSKPKDGAGGISIDGFPGQNHCLTCGECVRACEHQFRRQDPALVPLRLSFRPHPDEARSRAAPPAPG